MDNQLGPPKSSQPSELPQRRRFIGWLAGGLGALAGASLVGWQVYRRWPQVPNGTAQVLPPLPTREAFANQVQSSFVIEGSERKGEPLDLKLVEVSAAKLQKARERTFQSFSILFEGPKKSVLTQQTCTFKHPRLGTFELFLVPIGKPKGEVVRYEAVFTIFQS
ncbi:MAG TPA: hypothetical protein VKX17_07500 [Planctomycetota bacterium]|nr:hypothetical protein [Planctomycetota bacterium]